MNNIIKYLDCLDLNYIDDRALGNNSYIYTYIVEIVVWFMIRDPLFIKHSVVDAHRSAVIDLFHVVHRIEW